MAQKEKVGICAAWDLAGGDRRVGVARGDDDLDARVDEFLGDERGLRRVRAGILGDELDRELAGDAAGGIDFLDGHFEAAQRRLVIGGEAAGLGGRQADDEILGKRGKRRYAKCGGQEKNLQFRFHYYAPLVVMRACR